MHTCTHTHTHTYTHTHILIYIYISYICWRCFFMFSSKTTVKWCSAVIRIEPCVTLGKNHDYALAQQVRFQCKFALKDHVNNCLQEKSPSRAVRRQSRVPRNSRFRATSSSPALALLGWAGCGADICSTLHPRCKHLNSSEPRILSHSSTQASVRYYTLLSSAHAGKFVEQCRPRKVGWIRDRPWEKAWQESLAGERKQVGKRERGQSKRALCFFAPVCFTQAFWTAVGTPIAASNCSDSLAKLSEFLQIVKYISMHVHFAGTVVRGKCSWDAPSSGATRVLQSSSLHTAHSHAKKLQNDPQSPRAGSELSGHKGALHDFDICRSVSIPAHPCPSFQFIPSDSECIVHIVPNFATKPCDTLLTLELNELCPSKPSTSREQVANS